MQGPIENIQDVWSKFVSLGLITESKNKTYKKDFQTKNYWRVFHVTWSDKGLWTSLNARGVLYEHFIQLSKMHFLSNEGKVLTGTSLVLGKLHISYGCIKLK